MLLFNYLNIITPMEHSGLLLPLNVIARHLDNAILTQKIRKNFVKITFNKLRSIQRIPENEQKTVRILAQKIGCVEPDLSAAVLAKM